MTPDGLMVVDAAGASSNTQRQDWKFSRRRRPYSFVSLLLCRTSKLIAPPRSNSTLQPLSPELHPRNVAHSKAPNKLFADNNGDATAWTGAAVPKPEEIWR